MQMQSAERDLLRRIVLQASKALLSILFPQARPLRLAVVQRFA